MILKENRFIIGKKIFNSMDELLDQRYMLGYKWNSREYRRPRVR